MLPLTDSDVRRFWKYVAKSDDGCWEWKAQLTRDGYGHLKVGRTHLRAHRISYVLAHGAIPDGLHVLHSCDNRGCVRPSHLSLGTHDDNMRDMAQRGRARSIPQPGEKNPHARLTAEQVLAIRRDYKICGAKALAERHCISVGQVRCIAYRQRWAHLPEEARA